VIEPEEPIACSSKLKFSPVPLATPLCNPDRGLLHLANGYNLSTAESRKTLRSRSEAENALINITTLLIPCRGIINNVSPTGKLVILCTIFTTITNALQAFINYNSIKV